MSKVMADMRASGRGNSFYSELFACLLAVFYPIGVRGASALEPNSSVWADVLLMAEQYRRTQDADWLVRAIATNVRREAEGITGLISNDVALLSVLAPFYDSRYQTESGLLVVTHVPPPVGYDAGVAPEAVVDSAQRADYEKRISENRALAQKQKAQMAIRRVMAEVVALVCAQAPQGPPDAIEKEFIKYDIPKEMYYEMSRSMFAAEIAWRQNVHMMNVTNDLVHCDECSSNKPKMKQTRPGCGYPGRIEPYGTTTEEIGMGRQVTNQDKGGNMKNNCVFCAIAEGEIPSFKVYEDDLVLAYLDINPFTEGHTLVIPKAHTTGLLDTPDETLAATIARVKKVAAHLKDALPCDGFNILQNNGESAGQTVRHVHFHIVPRYAKDAGAEISIANRKGDMEHLAALAERIRM